MLPYNIQMSRAGEAGLSRLKRQITAFGFESDFKPALAAPARGFPMAGPGPASPITAGFANASRLLSPEARGLGLSARRAFKPTPARGASIAAPPFNFPPGIKRNSGAPCVGTGMRGKISSDVNSNIN